MYGLSIHSIFSHLVFLCREPKFTSPLVFTGFPCKATTANFFWVKGSKRLVSPITCTQQNDVGFSRHLGFIPKINVQRFAMTGVLKFWKTLWEGKKAILAFFFGSPRHFDFSFYRNKQTNQGFKTFSALQKIETQSLWQLCEKIKTV